MVVKVWRGTDVWEGSGTNAPEILEERVDVEGDTIISAYGTRYRYPRYALSLFHLRLPDFGSHDSLVRMIADPGNVATLAVHGATYTVVKVQPTAHHKTPVGEGIEVWLGEHRESDPYGSVATGVAGGGYIFAAGSCVATLSPLVFAQESVYSRDAVFYRDDEGHFYNNYAQATIVRRTFDFPYLSDPEVYGLVAVLRAGQRLGGNITLDGTGYFVEDTGVTFQRGAMYWRVVFHLIREESEISEGATS